MPQLDLDNFLAAVLLLLLPPTRWGVTASDLRPSFFLVRQRATIAPSIR
jgi:hypothetical protein